MNRSNLKRASCTWLCVLLSVLASSAANSQEVQNQTEVSDRVLDEHPSTKNNGLSCEELYEEIKASDCAEIIRPWLDGAELLVGVSWNTLNITLVRDQAEKALLLSEAPWPGPYVSLSLKDIYFGGSEFGWTTGFSYLDNYALSQRISRNGEQLELDLGTYGVGFMVAAQPSLFYAFGGRDASPDQYFKLGLGISLGYASVRGSAFLTQDTDEITPLCDQAVNDTLVAGTGSDGLIEQNCELANFNSSGLGAGGRIFIEAGYRDWQLDIDTRSLLISGSEEFDLQPAETSITLSYKLRL